MRGAKLHTKGEEHFRVGVSEKSPYESLGADLGKQAVQQTGRRKVTQIFVDESVSGTRQSVRGPWTKEGGKYDCVTGSPGSSWAVSTQREILKEGKPDVHKALTK